MNNGESIGQKAMAFSFFDLLDRIYKVVESVVLLFLQEPFRSVGILILKSKKREDRENVLVLRRKRSALQLCRVFSKSFASSQIRGLRFVTLELEMRNSKWLYRVPPDFFQSAMLGAGMISHDVCGS